MKKLVLIFLILGLFFTSAWSQKTCVIANAENHVPIREALIHTDNNHWARTDYRGYWTMKYQFDSATVSKPGFLKTTVYLKNLPDTLFLLPEAQQLGTVEVWGKNQQQVRTMEEQAHEAAKDTPSMNSGVSFDFAKLLDKRGRRDAKHLKTARTIMGEYGRKDPIVSAYEQATGKKYELHRPEKQNAPLGQRGLVDLSSYQQSSTSSQQDSSSDKQTPSVEETFNSAANAIDTEGKPVDSSSALKESGKSEKKKKKTQVFIESSVGITM